MAKRNGLSGSKAGATQACWAKKIKNTGVLGKKYKKNRRAGQKI